MQQGEVVARVSCLKPVFGGPQSREAGDGIIIGGTVLTAPGDDIVTVNAQEWIAGKFAR